MSVYKISGAVVKGEYMDYPFGGIFTEDGSIYDNQRNGHPPFDLSLDEIINLEFKGKFDGEYSVEHYLTRLSIELFDFKVYF